VHPRYVTCHCGFHELVSFFLICWSCERILSKRRLLVLPSNMLLHRVHTFAYLISSRSILCVQFQVVTPVQLINHKLCPVTFTESAPPNLQADQHYRHQESPFHHLRNFCTFSWHISLPFNIGHIYQFLANFGEETYIDHKTQIALTNSSLDKFPNVTELHINLCLKNIWLTNFMPSVA